MIKIKNLKTEKTEKQIKNEWNTVKGQKHLLLTHTDWTQLSDVPLVNKEEFVKWRKTLRKAELETMFDVPSQAMEFLVKYEERLPKPVFDFSMLPFSENQLEPKTEGENDRLENLTIALDELQEQVKDIKEKKDWQALEQKVTALEDLLNSQINTFEILSLEDAHKIIVNHYTQLEGNKSLDRLLQFPILAGQVEQALDFLSDPSSNINDYYLLDNPDSSVDDKEYAHSVIRSYKEFLKNQKELRNDFQKQIQSVYTMSIEDVNGFFNANGYRYRCSHEGESH